MNNIDILEEKEKEAIELLKQEPDFSLSYYERENAIDIVLKLVETLISENKELKEKNNELEVINKMQEYRISVIDERELISKSKIEEKIEEIIQGSKYFNVISPLNRNKEYYETRYAVEVLQSLLGKE